MVTKQITLTPGEREILLFAFIEFYNSNKNPFYLPYIEHMQQQHKTNCVLQIKANYCGIMFVDNALENFNKYNNDAVTGYAQNLTRINVEMLTLHISLIEQTTDLKTKFLKLFP